MSPKLNRDPNVTRPELLSELDITVPCAQTFSGKICIAKGSDPTSRTIVLDGQNGFVWAGTRVVLTNKASKHTVSLLGDGGNVVLRNAAGQDTVALVGENAHLFIGNQGANGRVILRNADGKDTIAAVGDSGNILLRNAAGQDTVWLYGEDARIALGREGFGGNVVIRNAAGEDTVALVGDSAHLYLGSSGANGRIVLRNAHGEDTVALLGDSGNITFRNAAGQETISLVGTEGNIQVNGDITLRNADCAEEFDVSDVEDAEPGCVMVLDQEGKLQQSRNAYDKKVVGVVSGAGDFKPGIVFDKNRSLSNRLPLALMGKVFCKVDAQYSAIAMGDLLTTSPTPGHAMKADDPFKAFGSVIGKALHPLNGGLGLIAILVALQ